MPTHWNEILKWLRTEEIETRKEAVFVLDIFATYSSEMRNFHKYEKEKQQHFYVVQLLAVLKRFQCCEDVQKSGLKAIRFICNPTSEYDIKKHSYQNSRAFSEHDACSQVVWSLCIPSPCRSLSLSLSLSHTHTKTYTQAHTHTYTNTHVQL